MNKNIIAIAAALLLTGPGSIPAAAAEEVEVYVTISDGNGALALAAEPIVVTDADGDGVVSICDALYLAHEAHYTGGADAGFAAGETEFGISMSKLWGTENGSVFGYYVNNVSPQSLGDAVQAGDFISAYCITDATAFSDLYCFFDEAIISVGADKSVHLELNANSYDENWNPVVIPVENAVLTIDEERTEFVTDADGAVTFTLEEPGTHVISAVSDSQLLVPPVCKAEVTAPATEPATQAPTESTTPTPVPGTGDSTGIAAALLAVGAAGLSLLSAKRNGKR